jgi:hypothetical protein
LPETATNESKFNINESVATPSSTTVILESLNEGETVTSNQPQFFGKGPKGEPITITVHSQDVVTGSVTIPSSGSWSWSPSSTLEAGAHTITISWVDATGITRSLTRDFVVQAGEAPAFTASSSGSSPTPTPTSTPTGIPTPTASPVVLLSATPTPTAIASPTSTPTASPMAIPVTGNLTPTILLFMIGVVILSFSAFIWKLAEN